MLNHFSLILAASTLIISLPGCSGNEKVSERQSRDILFDNDWKFLRDSIAGAEEPGFDDSGWRILDLPHDWSIEDLPGGDSESQTGPFSRESPGARSTGHVIGGTAWYRKHFTLDRDDAGKTVYVRFDGIYMESDVWVNGKHAGYHPYGYTSFYYDITEYLNAPGQDNVIAVRVHNTGQNSRWYSGSGIYRHVWLTVVEPVHFDTWGLFVMAPFVTGQFATLALQTSLINKRPETVQAELRSGIYAPDGSLVATNNTSHELQAAAKTVTRETVTVYTPALWSVDTPDLYTAKVRVLVDGKETDVYETRFGIRALFFTPEEGFRLNGKDMLLKGANLHHDNGLLGAAAFDRAEERRVATMKANGFNAIRTSHNPPSPAFLDACDRLGMLVIDEAFDHWERPKNPMDYARFFKEWHEQDLASMVLRDRNHPSIIIWSIGNEVNERADTSGVRIAHELKEIINSLDPSRPVTNAICGFWDHPGREWEETAPAFEPLDIHGYNYQWQQYEPDHRQYPERIMAGTESVAKEAYENWGQVERNIWVIGDFVWTGMDYLGESGIGRSAYIEPGQEMEFLPPWPWYLSWCGDIDICGHKKPQSYYRDVVWDESNLEMAVRPPVPGGKEEWVSFWGWPNELPSWNWTGREGQLMRVAVYADYPQVQLSLNGEVIGTKSITEADKLTALFEVPFRPGKLTAAGLQDGVPVETKQLTTTGPPSALKLTAEHPEIPACRSEIAYLTIEVVDQSGQLVTDADADIQLSISGNGDLLAAGNADPVNMTRFRDNQCRSFRGRALVIVRSDGSQGSIEVSAASPGLTTAQASIKTAAK